MERLRRIQSALTLICLLVTSGARADESPDFFHKVTPLPARLIPEYTPCTYNQLTYACFDREQVKSLYMLELQAQYWHQEWLQTTALLKLKDAQLDTLNQQKAILLAASGKDDQYIKQLEDKLVTETKEKYEWKAKAENPPTWPLWVGGTVGVLGLGAFLSSLLR